MRGKSIVVGGVSALLFVSAQAQSPQNLQDIAKAPDPAWLAGAWIQQNGDEWADEYWTPPRGGVMIGAARIGKGDALQSFEHTRIVRKADGTLVFIAQPGGAPPSEFPMIASGPRDISFANPAHDYPQKIRYWRDGKMLRAEISKIDGSSKMQWRYKPMGGGR